MALYAGGVLVLKRAGSSRAFSNYLNANQSLVLTIALPKFSARIKRKNTDYFFKINYIIFLVGYFPNLTMIPSALKGVMLN
jgi:hypothetical protein